MKQKTVVKHREELYKQEQIIQNKIDKLREYCPHEGLIYKLDGSSGGWDNESSYWTVFRCLDCGKHWVEDNQDWKSREERFPNAKEINRWNDSELYKKFTSIPLNRKRINGRETVPADSLVLKTSGS